MMDADDVVPERSVADAENPYAAGTGAAAMPPAQLIDVDALPPLYQDHSFWGMVVTQFLGAFNDNLFKQLMLLLALEVAGRDRQDEAMFVFSAPFVIFSGYAGYLADRHGKRLIIMLAKVAEILVMALGLVAFVWFGRWGFAGLLVVLFLMGTHSAFFGPSKYGILPEMLRARDLPRANGIIAMTTFLAIIFGTVVAGPLCDLAIDEGVPLDATAHRLWIASLVCMGIAVAGLLTSFLVRRVPAAVPNLRFTWSALTMTPENRQMLSRDRLLLGAVWASSIFWMVSGVALSAVNSLGKIQLGLTDTRTSMLVGCTGVGLALGSVLAGRLSRGIADFRVMRIGGWGFVASLLVVSLPGPTHGHLLGFGGTFVVLIAVGMFAGMYAIPLQVFMQSRPPEGQKGRMIAVMNQANFVAIMMSAVVYWLFDRWTERGGLPRCAMFAMTAAVMLIALLLYRPRGQTERTGDVGD